MSGAVSNFDFSQDAAMRRVEEGKKDFSQNAVMQKLEDGKHAADRVKNKVAPKTGYLDTQLFPGKKEPAPYEKSYAFPDPLSTEKKV